MPRWRRDGREIFFITVDGKLWSVDVKTGVSTFEPGVPKLLFETRIRDTDPVNEVSYDVSANGQRFLIASIPGDAVGTGDAAGPEPITVILNWNATLTKK